MEVRKIPLEKTGLYEKTFVDYINQSPDLSDFYNYPPEQASFDKALEEHTFLKRNREILHQELSKQYAQLKCEPRVLQNIDLLKLKNTFTVTTGHQLNLATGPLYFVYKIVSTINLASQLKEKYPEYNFVPVYWMASEDHDFDEINHFSLFGETYRWQTDQQGAVGRFKTHGLSEVLNLLKEQPDILREAYEQPTLSLATQTLVNNLFGQNGLVIIEADNAELKKLFTPVIEDELKNQKSSDLVHETSENLTELGYKAQVHARDINLFYLQDGLRERIVKKEDKYQVLNTDIVFTEQGIISEAHKHPEKFSPNVILRPVYQQLILPNLAYLGGPAEVIYWLQLKSVFDHFKAFFPIISPRNMALIIPGHVGKKIKKLGLSADNLLKSEQEIVEAYLEQGDDGEINLEEAKSLLKKAFLQIAETAEKTDKSLEGFVKAEEAKSLKSIENIEKRLAKALKQKHEVSLKQIKSIKEKLFPEGVPQERYDNLFSFYINDPEFIEKLYPTFDPLDFNYLILEE